MAKEISRAKYNGYFKTFGIILLLAGAVLKYLSTLENFAGKNAIWNINRTIYDLPIFLIIIGLVVALKGFLSKSDGDNVIFSGKSFGEFLTNNAILLAMFVLVVVICILQPKFMQIRVALDILTQSSTKLIMALGICFTLLIAGTDLSAGRMVGLAAVISASMLFAAS